MRPENCSKETAFIFISLRELEKKTNQIRAENIFRVCLFNCCVPFSPPTHQLIFSFLPRIFG